MTKPDIERQGAAAGDQEGLAEAHLPHQLGCDPEREDEQSDELEQSTGPVSPGQGDRLLRRGSPEARTSAETFRVRSRRLVTEYPDDSGSSRRPAGPESSAGPSQRRYFGFGIRTISPTSVTSPALTATGIPRPTPLFT